MSYLLLTIVDLRVEGLGVFNSDVLVVVVVVFSGVFVGGFLMLVLGEFASSGLLSFFDSLLGFVDFSLGDLAVSFVGPHGVGSQVFSSTIDPGSVRDISDASALVIIADFHGALIGETVDSLDLGEESLLFFKFVEGPSGANGEDFLAGVGAVSLTVDHFASLEGLDGSHATSGELVGGEDEVGVAGRGETFSLPSFLLGFVV